MPSLATFNANNLFLRYKFKRIYPGDMSLGSLVEDDQVGVLGYLPGIAFDQYTSNYVVWDEKRRNLLARALKAPDDRLPDILCFQEVENIQAIRILNQRYLGNHYAYSLLIDGYDPRNIDVGILSRFPIGDVRTHIDEIDSNGERIFSRDCLEADIGLPGEETLTLFVNHLKSKLVRRNPNETDASYHSRVLLSHQRRLAQAREVATRVRRRFWGQHSTALYAVVGDVNDTAESPWVAPLVNSPHLTDLLVRHRPTDDRWTYYYRSKNRATQLDYVLASKALRDRVDAVVASDANKAPYIERRGLGFRELNASGQVLPAKTNLVHFEPDAVTPTPATFTSPSKIPFRFQRYPEVLQNWTRNISDHCPVKVWF